MKSDIFKPSCMFMHAKLSTSVCTKTNYESLNIEKRTKLVV